MRYPANPAAVCWLLAWATVSCEPVIGTGTYFCGPERLCPPEQQCDDSSYTCASPTEVRAFMCPADSESSEPDGQLMQARDLGRVVCGNSLLAIAPGCIPAPDDVDYYKFRRDAVCTGTSPHIAITLRYPVALVALTVELLDDSGAVLATGELCTPPLDYSGQDSVCLERNVDQGRDYYVRVRIDERAPDCAGDCRFNQYTLDIQYPLS